MSKESPSSRRENALSEMLGRLGAAKTKDERYNNGQAHFSLAVFTSWSRAFEKRMALVVRRTEAIILEAIPVDKEAKPEELVGQTITLEQGLFLNSMTLTKWVENFYQESPSINALARKDQVSIGMEAFKTPAFAYWQPGGETDEDLVSDSKGGKR
jgi:hypothetical protein